MAQVALGSVARQLGTLFEGGLAAGISDRELLERFTAGAGRATRPLSRRSFRVTDRWCWPSAGSSWTITITPKTPFRQSSWYWHVRRDRYGIQTCLARGCMASHSERPALLAVGSPRKKDRGRTGDPDAERQSGQGGRSGDARARAGRGAASRARPFAGRIPRASRTVLLRGADTGRGGPPAAMAAWHASQPTGAGA